jgi:chemotaxis protein MotB
VSADDVLGQSDDDHDDLPVRRPPHVEEGEGSWLVSYADMMTLLCGFFLILLSFSQTDPDQMEKVKKAASQVFGGEYQKPFEGLSNRIAAIVKQLGMGDQVVITENEKGVMVAFRGALFFESGSGVLRAQAKQLMDKLVPELLPDAGQFYFLVEGHTDSVPTHTDAFASNWELSSVRACTVLRIFEDEGFPKNRLKAVGYADTQPIFPEKDAQGNAIPQNQAQNRRVVIKILKALGE